MLPFVTAPTFCASGGTIRTAVLTLALKKWNIFHFYRRSRDGTVVKALASHQCGPGSRPCSEGFSPGSPVFLPSQKPTFPNSNSIWNPRATGLSVVRLLRVTLVKQSWFMYLFTWVLCGWHTSWYLSFLIAANSNTLIPSTSSLLLFSFWIQISFAKICWSCVVINCAKIPLIRKHRL